MKNPILRALFACLLLPLSTQLHAESRAWSNREGKVIEAELVTYDPVTKNVTLKLPNGKQPTLALDTLE